MRARLRRFLRPSLRRPFPVFLTPMQRSLPSVFCLSRALRRIHAADSISRRQGDQSHAIGSIDRDTYPEGKGFYRRCDDTAGAGWLESIWRAKAWFPGAMSPADRPQARQSHGAGVGVQPSGCVERPSAGNCASATPPFFLSPCPLFLCVSPSSVACVFSEYNVKLYRSDQFPALVDEICRTGRDVVTPNAE